ncbi:hypothetical protein D9M68_805590 [compost metagenome]
MLKHPKLAPVTNSEISESFPGQLHIIIDIAAVEDHRSLEGFFDFIPVWQAEFVPLGNQCYSICGLNCLIHIIAEVYLIIVSQ